MAVGNLNYREVLGGRIEVIHLQSKELSASQSEASIVQDLAFFMVQLSHPYMTTGKTTALTI